MKKYGILYVRTMTQTKIDRHFANKNTKFYIPD